MSATFGILKAQGRRGADHLPRQGDRPPWRVLNDYLRDAVALKLGRVTNPALQFS